MKLNYKLLIIFLILINVIFCFNDVNAVGRVAQGWKIVREGAEEPDLIFRTYTTPHSSTLKEYTNTQSEHLLEENKQDGSKWTYITYKGTVAYSKWIYNEDVDVPGRETFGTVRMVFHKEPFCTYTQNEKGSWGYNKLEKDITLTDNLGAIQDIIINSKRVKTTPKKNNVSADNEIYAVEKITGTYYKAPETGTGLFLRNIQRGKITEYRYALVKESSLQSKRNIYIEDSIVYSEDLKKLVAKLNNANQCYVSDELLSEYIKSANRRTL